MGASFNNLAIDRRKCKHTVCSALGGGKAEEATAGTYWAHRAAKKALCYLYASKLISSEVVVRVEQLIAYANLEVQMRTGRPPGRSHEGYLLSLAHLLTGADQDPTRMGVMVFTNN